MEGLLDQFSEMKLGIEQSREEIFKVIDTTIVSIESTRDQVRQLKITSGEDDPSLQILNAINTLARNLDSAKPTQRIVEIDVEYFKGIAKFGKNIGKYMNPSIEDANHKIQFSKDIINKLILDYMCKNGLVESVEKFCTEGRLTAPTENKRKYEELGEIRKELQSKRLEKATEWAQKNQSILTKSNSDVLFTLHKLQVIICYSLVYITCSRTTTKRMY